MIQLSDHFTIRKILRYTFPSMIMLAFTSIYGVVDGLFVSNFVGKTAFAAVNFIWPLPMLLSGVGFMFGTGGGALIAKTLGQGDAVKANRIFSLIVYVSIALGILLTGVGYLALRPFAIWFGAEGQLLEDSLLYGKYYMLGVPFCLLQLEFQCLFPTAEKPQLGLAITVIAGLCNTVLDALLVAVFPYGLAGAALATVASQVFGGIVPLFYFARRNQSLLRLTAPASNLRYLVKSSVNGSSELMSNISMSIVTILYNWQLLRVAGENGLAAFGVITYVGFIFLSLFIGYATGLSPVVSYHYGAENHQELRGLLRRGALLVVMISVVMFLICVLFASPLSRVFIGYDHDLLDMTIHGFYVSAFAFLFNGFAIFGSAFFTALNDGPVSAAISFLRTLAYQVLSVVILPLFWGLDGIWVAMVLPEVLAVFTVFAFLKAKRPKYHY